MGGHASAGIRGISRVEISVDSGDTWADARLWAPLPETDVWRQWASEFEPVAGTAQVVVRATDETGRRQPHEARPPFPRGATGWVSETVDG